MTSEVTLLKLKIVDRIAICILETTVGVEKFIEILIEDATSILEDLLIHFSKKIGRVFCYLKVLVTLVNSGFYSLD